MAEVSTQQTQAMMGVTSDKSSCEEDFQEKGDKQEIELCHDQGGWNKNFKKAHGRPQKKVKKVKEDASLLIPSKSSAIQSPSGESIMVIECQANSSSHRDTSCNHHHEPTEKDVVFGKGRFIQNLAGNVRLRRLIKSHFDQYESADSPQDKTLMAMRLVADIKASGGKFLKEDTSAPGRYIEVDSITAREKIAATFHSHRRRSKQSKAAETATNESKAKIFTTSSTEASETSLPSLVGANSKANDQQSRSFPGRGSVMELGLGRQGNFFGSPSMYTTSLLQHGLNLSPRRTFELSDEIAARKSSIHTTNMVPFEKGSFVPDRDRGSAEKYAGVAALAEKKLHKLSENPKVGRSLSPVVLEGMMAHWNKKTHANLLGSSISAGYEAKNSQAHLASTYDSTMKNRLTATCSQIGGVSSFPIRTSSAAPVLNANTLIASRFGPFATHSHHFPSKEALQIQLYREMGLPGY